MEEPNLDPTSIEGEKQLPPVPPVEGAVEPEKGAGKEEVEKPPEPPKEPEKTRTDEEWNKRQSSWDTGLEELRKQHKDELKQIRTELVTRQRKDFLAQVEAAGEDVEKAGKLFDREQASIAKEQELTALAQVLDGAKKDRDADELIGKFGLDKTVKDSLLKAETPSEMTTLALEMALEATKAKETPPIKTPSGVKTPKAFDASTATPRERLSEHFRENVGGD